MPQPVDFQRAELTDAISAIDDATILVNTLCSMSTDARNGVKVSVDEATLHTALIQVSQLLATVRKALDPVDAVIRSASTG
jgi:hypothetical protein